MCLRAWRGNAGDCIGGALTDRPTVVQSFRAIAHRHTEMHPFVLYLHRLALAGSIVTLSGVGLASSSLAADAPDPPKLAVEVSLYPYMDPVKTDTDLSATVTAALSGRFSYFSFFNYRGVLSPGGVTFDRTEQNLRFSLSDRVPIDLNLQAVLVGGNADDHVQLGIGWRVNDTVWLKDIFERLSLTYRLTFHLTQMSTADQSFWQMEHNFRMSFPRISERLYLSGFLDHTFGLERNDNLPKHPVVTEIQFGVRLFARLYAVTEYRINDYRPAEPHNIGVGFEYKFRW